MQVFIFGHSLAFGAYDKEGGYGMRLRQYLWSKLDLANITEESLDYNVHILGVGGDTTRALLNRFEPEIEARLWGGDDPVLIIFDIGANDTQIVKSTGKKLVSKEKFEENLAKLIEKARKYSPRIVFLGMIPIEESKTNPLPWKRKYSLNNNELELYDNALKRTCKEKDVDYIPQYKEFFKLGTTIYVDGVHPNSKGHRKIFNNIKNYLIKEKLIE